MVSTLLELSLRSTPSPLGKFLPRQRPTQREIVQAVPRLIHALAPHPLVALAVRVPSQFERQADAVREDADGPYRIARLASFTTAPFFSGLENLAMVAEGGPVGTLALSGDELADILAKVPALWSLKILHTLTHPTPPKALPTLASLIAIATRIPHLAWLTLRDAAHEVAEDPHAAISEARRAKHQLDMFRLTQRRPAAALRFIAAFCSLLPQVALERAHLIGQEGGP